MQKLGKQRNLLKIVNIIEEVKDYKKCVMWLFISSEYKQVYQVVL